MKVAKYLVSDWVFSRMQISMEIFQIPCPRQAGVLCIFGTHTVVLISWVSKKRTAVSHSNIATEIISLDARLRMRMVLPRFTYGTLLL